MSGGQPPNYYGFTPGPGGAPYYPGPHPSAPTHFPSAPYPGATTITHISGPPTYIHPPQYFPPATTVTNYFPAGETQFTSSFVSPSNASNISTGFRWVHWQMRQMLPAHAVEAGYDIDRTKIYVGRVNHKNEMLPAKVIPQKNVAYISFGGQELSFSNCEILCQERVNWVRDSNGRVPAGATPVGRTSSGETLFAARVHHNGSLTVGKVHPSHRVCYIPFDGKEISFREYEVLVL